MKYTGTLMVDGIQAEQHDRFDRHMASYSHRCFDKHLQLQQYTRAASSSPLGTLLIITALKFPFISIW